MFDLDYTGWAFSTWVLYVLAALFLLGFFAYWFRFQAAQRRALAEGGRAVADYNRLLRGFPNAVYAKMFGKRPLEAVKAEGTSEAKP